MRRSAASPIAITLSDVHWSHAPPKARAGEANWYTAMMRPWEQVYELYIQHGMLDVIIAGDLFHHWQQPPELLNFLIDWFRARSITCWALPGQHDLPSHRYEAIKRSAYWNLCEAGVVRHVDKITTLPGQKTRINIHPFPWGRTVVPCPTQYLGDEFRVNLAVVHAYVWMQGSGYVGADPAKMVAGYATALAGYDAAIFGDNHKGFTRPGALEGGGTLMNCGAFLRRNSDEWDYRPQVGLLYEDGTIEPHLLSLEHEVLDRTHTKGEVEELVDMRQLVRELAQLETTTTSDIDFKEAVRLWVEEHRDTISDRAVAILMETLSI